MDPHDRALQFLPARAAKTSQGHTRFRTEDNSSVVKGVSSLDILNIEKDHLTLKYCGLKLRVAAARTHAKPRGAYPVPGQHTEAPKVDANEIIGNSLGVGVGRKHAGSAIS